MIKEDYVSFEIAKLLKENGFDESIETLITPEGKLYHLDENSISHKKHETICNSQINVYSNDVSCPTLQMAMKWIREIYDLHVVPRKDFFNGTYTGMIYDGRRKNVFNKEDYIALVGYETYEEAVEASLRYILE